MNVSLMLNDANEFVMHGWKNDKVYIQIREHAIVLSDHYQQSVYPFFVIKIQNSILLMPPAFYDSLIDFMKGHVKEKRVNFVHNTLNNDYISDIF